MALSPHPVRVLLASLAVVLFLVTSLLAPRLDASEPSGARITAVANVTVRTTPSAEAPIVAQLPLGTEVRESGPSGLDKTWVLVRLADTREGWVQTRLTKPLDSVWRWPIFDGIMADRLARKGDGFAARVELVSFIERVVPEYSDRDGRARVELARLQALALAAAAIPFNQSKREPFASWLSARQDDLVYDEPGGHWMLRDSAIWAVHARHGATPVADDIAWFAVTTGLAGECEGHVSCYLQAQNRLQGAYLRAHPAGRHAASAVDAVVTLLTSVAPSGVVNRRYRFDQRTDCKELSAAVDGLTSAIQGARAAGWETAVEGLKSVRNLCQGRGN